MKWLILLLALGLTVVPGVTADHSEDHEDPPENCTIPIYRELPLYNPANGEQIVVGPYYVCPP
jgi:hypothetical protein